MIDTKGWTEEEKRIVRVGLVFAAAIIILCFMDGYLLISYLAEPLNLTSGSISVFSRTRTILLFFSLSAVLPSSVLIELADSRTKRRNFRLRNILLALLMLGEILLVASLLLTLFNAFFSEFPILVQALLTAIGVSIPILLGAANFRIRRIREYYMKAFK